MPPGLGDLITQPYVYYAASLGCGWRSFWGGYWDPRLQSRALPSGLFRSNRLQVHNLSLTAITLNSVYLAAQPLAVWVSKTGERLVSPASSSTPILTRSNDAIALEAHRLGPGLDWISRQAKSPPALFAWRTAERMAAEIASAPYAPTSGSSPTLAPRARRKSSCPIWIWCLKNITNSEAGPRGAQGWETSGTGAQI